MFRSYPVHEVNNDFKYDEKHERVEGEDEELRNDGGNDIKSEQE